MHNYKYLILLLLIASCTTSEKIAQRALTDPVAFGKVGQVYRRLNPCINDTTVIAKSDTIIAVHADTVVNYQTLHELGKSDTFFATITKYKQVNIHDTARYYTKDLTAQRIAEDSATFYKNLFLQEHGNTVDAIDEKKKWKLWFWLLLGGIVGVSGLLVYLNNLPSINGLFSKLKK